MIGLVAWATRPISEEEGQWRAERAFKVAAVGLTGAAYAAAFVAFDRWVFRDWEVFVLCSYATFVLALVAAMLSFAGLNVFKQKRTVAIVTAVLSLVLCAASLIESVTFRVPLTPELEKYEGSLLKREPRAP
jgi:hypothetical protein